MIALVITIIVLLILAGVAIVTLTGENGILNRAKAAAEASKKASAKERLQTELLSIQAEKVTNGEEITIEALDDKKEYLTSKDIIVADTGLPRDVTLDGYTFKVKNDLTIDGEGTSTGTNTGSGTGSESSSGNESGSGSEGQQSSGTGGLGDSQLLGTVTTSVLEKNGKYIKININAQNSSEARFYGVLLNGELVEISNSNEIVIWNLSCSTTYNIVGYAFDKNNNIKKSASIEETTLDHQYLYKEGQEFATLTGGWIHGNHNIGTFDKKTNHLNLYQNIVNNSVKNWNCCNTKNKIDVTNYEYVKFKVSFDNTWFNGSNNNYYSNSRLAVCDPEFYDYSTPNAVVSGGGFYSGPIDRKGQILECELNVQTVNKGIYPTVEFRLWGDQPFEVNIDIYDVWLE